MPSTTVFYNMLDERFALSIRLKYAFVFPELRSPIMCRKKVKKEPPLTEQHPLQLFHKTGIQDSWTLQQPLMRCSSNSKCDRTARLSMDFECVSLAAEKPLYSINSLLG